MFHYRKVIGLEEREKKKTPLYSACNDQGQHTHFAWTNIHSINKILIGVAQLFKSPCLSTAGICFLKYKTYKYLEENYRKLQSSYFENIYL